jgi:transposase-like protein
MAEANNSGSRLKFSTVEKKQIVCNIEQGIYSINEAKSRYGIASKKTLYSWISMYAEDQSVSGKRPRYPLSLRSEAAMDVVTGKMSMEQAIRKYGVSKSAIKRWLRDFAVKNPLMKEEKQPKVAIENNDAKKQVEELQLKIAALETMIDLAEQHYKVDIRKKCGTKQQ